ncbi:MAG: nucleotidyltransferase domain-containing protein [Desulfurivibrionaceae bacterium]
MKAGGMVEENIRARLNEIEQDCEVKILYACESGSRAWGFASQDSDWDVRFVYLHRPEHYLAIDVERRRDVIEHLEGDLDLAGWDLRKALWLLHKSNPPLLEWLNSPIIYADRFDLATRLRAMTDIYYSPSACLHHYRHMAQGNFREYLQGEIVRTKKYLYVLRPLLAMRWIETRGGPPPMSFPALVESMLPDGRLKEAVFELLARKTAGMELAEGPRVPGISEFIEGEFARFEAGAGKEGRTPKPSLDVLNRLFREMLGVVWGGEENEPR